MRFKWNTYGFSCSGIFLPLIFVMIGILIHSLYQSFDTCLPRIITTNNTIIKIINQTKPRNLILSSGTTIPVLKIYRFIRSARSACNDCYIIIFTDKTDDNDIKQLAILYDVLFLSYHEYSPENFKHLRTVLLRFLIYYSYLLKNQYDNIFICDLSDVLFQKNIFNNMKKGIELYAFLESEELTIGGCHLHRQWFDECYNQNVLTTLFNKSRSCAGSTLGTYQGILLSLIFIFFSNYHSGIMRYLSLMDARLREKSICNDQGVHNYLVYLILNGTSTILIPHETGFVGSLGTSPWVYRNKYGLVLNKNNQVYSVIHQFYHSDQLKQQLNQEYHFLPDDVLKRKS